MEARISRGGGGGGGGGGGVLHRLHVDSSGRAGTGPCGRERPPGRPGAAVHRHALDRVNAINDSLKKKKKTVLAMQGIVVAVSSLVLQKL